MGMTLERDGNSVNEVESVRGEDGKFHRRVKFAVGNFKNSRSARRWIKRTLPPAVKPKGNVQIPRGVGTQAA